MTRICDYEGSQYRRDFWKTGNRRYEDLAERAALKALLPPGGERLIEVGAGFGRMADMYRGYRQVVLVDYARSQLEEAQQYLGRDERFIFVVADIYNLPFVDNLFDALVMVRVMHHLTDVPAALGELRRIICPAGTAVLEHASKRHLKAILRWLLRRQTWNPFDPAPHEFVPLNINFHPAWMRRRLAEAGFAVRRVRTVSHFRLPALKKLFPAPLLAALDRAMQPTGRWWQFTPSVFLRAVPQKPPTSPPVGFFKCPACHSPQLRPATESLACRQCGRVWDFRDGIYNFKVPLAGPQN